jgi:hypothetical protein
VLGQDLQRLAVLVDNAAANASDLLAPTIGGCASAPEGWNLGSAGGVMEAALSSLRDCVRALALPFLAGGLALALAGLAAAKEGARARLVSELPLQAPAGRTIQVEWTVHEHGGSQPFGALGMFVRLLSKTGAPATESVGTSTVPGLNMAAITVPAGGIGGIRVGLHGAACDSSGCRPAPVIFPLDNSPFASSGGAVCDVAALAADLRSFVRAYNSGDLRTLDRLFSKDNFVWYSSGGPGVRRLPDAENRATLLSYFRQRHRAGDLLSGLMFRFNGYEAQRELGHFELRAQRRAADFRSGRWFDVHGKGALDCSKRDVTIAVLSVGGPAA